MPRPKREPKPRLSLALTPSARARLDRVQALSDAETMSEAIRRALAVYEVMLNAQQNGTEIVLRTKRGERRLLMF